jgi:hypothetical protein
MSKNKLLDKFERVEKMIEETSNHCSSDEFRAKLLHIAKAVIKQKNNVDEEFVDYSNVLRFEPRKKQN